MFEEIAPTYDLLNHLLSFGLDFWWRGKAVQQVMEKRGGKFLDIAAGTGDLTIASLRAHPREVVSLDFALPTLRIARKKFQSVQGQTVLDLVSADAALLPLRDDSFDAVLVGFGVRNFPDILRALREFYRVLHPGGIVCILELSHPRVPLVSQVFRWYFHHVVPFIGGLVSRHSEAYRYLPESVEAFPEPDQFSQLILEAGFHNGIYRQLLWGVVVLYAGTK